jgi:hypothetical protein
MVLPLSENLKPHKTRQDGGRSWTPRPSPSEGRSAATRGRGIRRARDCHRAGRGWKGIAESNALMASFGFGLVIVKVSRELPMNEHTSPRQSASWFMPPARTRNRRFPDRPAGTHNTPSTQHSFVLRLLEYSGCRPLTGLQQHG